MITCDAKMMAEAELKAHGLDKNGWTFAWMAERTRRVFGHCGHGRKTVRLSPWYVRHNTEKLVRDTVLHEVAHALVGPGKGHGAEWKAKCTEIGAVPKRLKRGAQGKQPPVNRQTPKWVARCCDCGHLIRRARLSERAERGLLHHATCVTLLRWVRLESPELGAAMLDAGRTVRWELRQSDCAVYDDISLDFKIARGLSGHESAEKRLAADAELVFTLLCR